MSCPDHPQWFADREDCPFCLALDIRTEQQRRQSPPRVHVSQLRGEPPPPSQQASAAWQDVQPESALTTIGGESELMYYAADVERARAADAQQIAALRAENASMPLLQRLNKMEGRALIAEAQLTALQAEQAQWQQKVVDELRAVAAFFRTPGSIWSEDAIDECARTLENRANQLAALTAQQDKPDGDV